MGAGVGVTVGVSVAVSVPVGVSVPVSVLAWVYGGTVYNEGTDAWQSEHVCLYFCIFLLERDIDGAGFIRRERYIGSVVKAVTSRTHTYHSIGVGQTKSHQTSDFK